MRAIALAVLALALGGRAWADDELNAGRRLYAEALTASGDRVSALVGFGGTPLAGPVVACANCHGADGKGRPEGGVLPPDIRWDELTKPYGHVHATGRKHGPFSTKSFLRAVNEGIDPSGNRLDPAMPRFSFSRAQAQALIAYLKHLHKEREPGIGEHRVRIGVILPESGLRAAPAAAVRAALAAYADSVNEAGGIHRRRIELAVVRDARQAREQFAGQPVFAVLNALKSEDPAGVSALLAEWKVPVVEGFAGAGDDAQADPLVFRVLPGLDEQAAVLVEFAWRRGGRSALRAAIVASGAPQDRQAADAAARRCEARHCGDVLRIGWYARRFQPAEALERARAAGRDQIFFFGAPQEFAALLSEAGRRRDAAWRPTFYAPGTLVGAAVAARAAFEGELFLAFPESPVAQKHVLGTRYQAAQLAALSAAVVLTEGLRRAGRELSRDRLVHALETLNNYDPLGYGPAVSFGPDRRTGALGAYVVTLDARRGFAPASAWIALD